MIEIYYRSVTLSLVTTANTRDHSTFNWVYRFLVMGRIFKAAQLRFNVISGIEDYFNVLNDFKKLSLSIALALE